MKKVIIGGFISLIGSIWGLAIVFITGNNLISSWGTPPGRFLSTLIEMDLLYIFILSVVFIITGIIVMVIEFFRKEQ